MTTDRTAHAAPSAPGPPRPILVALGLAVLLAALDQTIVATALPTIAGDLGGLTDLGWVVTAYLLAATVSTPLYGKLGDVVGRQPVLLGAILVFLAGSALAVLAQSMLALVLLRAPHGLGAGGPLAVVLRAGSAACARGLRLGRHDRAGARRPGRGQAAGEARAIHGPGRRGVRRSKRRRPAARRAARRPAVVAVGVRGQPAG